MVVSFAHPLPKMGVGIQLVLAIVILIFFSGCSVYVGEGSNLVGYCDFDFCSLVVVFMLVRVIAGEDLCISTRLSCRNSLI